MHVSSLHVYPIKGCRGLVVPVAAIDALGFVGDRRLMLVDSSGRFVSQREDPLLATIAPALEGTSLTLCAAGVAPLVHEITADGATRDVTVWGNRIVAIDQGEAAAAWFAMVLGRARRLVWFGPGSTRPIDPKYSPRPDAETAFTDGYQVLITREASLADLNARLAKPVPMERFRPNIVVQGGAAWSEDLWREVVVGDLTFDAVKPCARCVVPTTDQQTGVRNPQQEPLRTLASFRTVPGLGAIFGQNLVARNTGRLAVGDQVVA
jgi:uncharacterized protein YcbX